MPSFKFRTNVVAHLAKEGRDDAAVPFTLDAFEILSVGPFLDTKALLRYTTILTLAGAAALFHLFAAGVSPFTAFVQRPVHFAFMAALGFLGVSVGMTHGLTGEATNDGARTSRQPGWVTVATRSVMITAAVFTCLYIVVVHQELVRRAGNATAVDLIAGALAIVITLELARRTTGLGLVIIALVALAYAFAGPWLPGLLAHRGYSASRVIEHLYLTTEGIWGVPLGVSADFVYLFVLFGAVLDAAGGGQLLIGLSHRIAGSTQGGPAKTATVASALMGSLSGSAVANVVTTGSLTIPVMKRSGFRPHFAGAIEAAASTGGQLMPPVMGAGAFILATWTNIPYVQVAAAAAIPAVLYYVALFMAIHFRARQVNLQTASAEATGTVASRVHLLVPLAVIVLLLVLGRSPMRAAFWGVMTAAGVTFISTTTRLGWVRARDALVGAAAGTVQVASACAAAGIVVGVASLTGIGLRMSEFIITLSGGHLPIALVLTAIGSIILGMGLPTTAAYIVLAALGAPALTQLGVPLLAAHLFIFYFGCLSNVTPPVSLAAYAAAGVAGAPPFKTAVTALGLSGAGFLVPFMFVYGPPLLLVGSTGSIVVAFATGVAGVTAFAAALIGHARVALHTWERILLGGAALCLLMPGLLTDTAGIMLGAAAMARQFRSLSPPTTPNEDQR